MPDQQAEVPADMPTQTTAKIDCHLCGADHQPGSPRCPLERVGQRIDGIYLLEAIIGIGGMGAVYRASHVNLPGSFALKMLHARWAHNKGLTERFYLEARAAASLGHPGIPDVRDIRPDADGVPYMVMEMLQGKNVAELTGPPPMPVECAVEIVVQALDALAAVHKRGVIHRDLKPNNLFLAAGSHGARVKVLDFGFAKIIDAEAALSGSEHAILGTIPYMSHEQAMDAHSSDARSDIYSMGATLFELLTGARPLDGTHPQMLSRLLDRQARRDPKSLRQEVPAFVDAAVGKAMEFDAADRYQSAGQMRDALEDGLRQWCPPARLARREHWLAELLGGDFRMGGTRSGQDPPAEKDRAAALAPTEAPTTRDGAAARRRSGTWVLIVGVIIAVVGTLAWRMGPRKPVYRQRTKQDGRPRLKMAPISGGPFILGSTWDEITKAYEYCDAIAKQFKGDKCTAGIYERERLQRAVELSSFQLDKWEVTNLDFAKWLTERRATLHIDDSKHVFDAAGKLLIDIGDEHSGIEHLDWGYHALDKDAQKPVVLVTWDGASSYCESDDKRLPTEAEWEYAAGGPEKRRFPWGNEEPRCKDVVFGRIIEGQCVGLPDRAQPVGQAAQDRTPDGVYDLGGNVAEWVMDRFSSEGYPSCPAPCKDPVYTPDGKGPDIRVYRGGSAYQNAHALRSAGRSRQERQAVMLNVGFRCAADAPAEQGSQSPKN